MAETVVFIFFWTSLGVSLTNGLVQQGTGDQDKFDSQRSTWVDVDTPPKAQTTTNSDGKVYHLVFSDEFEKAGRSFADGHDFKWTAIDRPDTVNEPLQYYKPEKATTSNGFLNITTTNDPVTWKGWNEDLKKWDKFTRHYSSAMLQGWNKFCFTGGIVELSVQLPGPGDQPGLWPAAWLMGNLGRATFQTSTKGVWPYSFDHCLHNGEYVGVDPNADDGQKISACSKDPGAGLNHNQGRGSPEVDIFEAMAGNGWGLVSHSLQVAPRLPDQLRPANGAVPGPGQWYKGMKFGKATMNTAYYGAPGVDALSANSQGTTDLYNSQHVFRLEWEPTDDGTLRWYHDGHFLFEVPAKTLTKEYGGLPSRELPAEPMYLILNTAMSNLWSPLCNDKDGAAAGTRCAKGSSDPCCILPAHYLIDYVRVYQQKDNTKQTIGCNPPSHPTSDYILANQDVYAPLLSPVPFPSDKLEAEGTSVFEEAVLILCGASLALAAIMKMLHWKRSAYVSIV